MVGEPFGGIPPWRQGENAALALRLRLNYGIRPVNVWDAIRKVGVALALEEFGKEGGDGRYLNKDGRALIIVNSAKRVARQRFTAAHELGHHELHRHERTNFVIRDDDVFATGGDPLEVAAGAFAGTFLAPAQGLAEALGGKREHAIMPEDVVALMGDFGLSYQATVYRLHNSGLITASRRDTLLSAGEGNVQALLAELGIDEDKVMPNKLALPLPPDYVEHVVTLWRHRHISDVRFAEMLRLGPEEAERYRERHEIDRPELPDYDEAAASKLLEELA